MKSEILNSKSETNPKPKIRNQKTENLLLTVKENVPLKKYTTFKIGGKAKYFFEAKTNQELVEALKAAKKMKMPFFILGEGSNVLVSDKGFSGLVIKLQTKNYKLKTNYLWAQAGVSFATLVKETGKKGLAGLEWAGGLPGTLGGAVFGNAGAFGGETKDNIVWVEALDKNFKIRKFTKKQCQFKYRSSIFKKRGWIVLSAMIKMKNGNRKKIQAIARLHIQQRRERGPLEYPNIGSIFKNCDLKDVPENALLLFKNVIKVDPFPVIPTAAVIAKTQSLMGIKVGGAQVSIKHPNFIINLGKARAKDVVTLIKLVKQKVKRKFGIVLEEEVRYVGF